MHKFCENTPKEIEIGELEREREEEEEIKGQDATQAEPVKATFL